MNAAVNAIHAAVQVYGKAQVGQSAVVIEYIDAFKKHYPEKLVEVKSKRLTNGERGYRVLIDGEPGDLLLSEADMRDATRMFQR